MRYIFLGIIKDISHMKLFSKILTISPVVLVLLMPIVQAQTTAPTKAKETDSSTPITVIKKTTEVSEIKRAERNKVDNAVTISKSDNKKIEKSNKTKNKQKPKPVFTGSGPARSRENPDG